MIWVWIQLLGLLLSLQKSKAAPVTETESLSQPTSQPFPAFPYGQHDGGLVLIEESNISILCYPCREIDADIPSISADRRKAVPTTVRVLINKRARKPTSVCPDHNTGKPRSYSLKCQMDGKGGGALCIG